MKKHVLVLILIVTLIATMFLLVACSRGVVCSEHDWRPSVIAEDGSVQSEICNNCGITRLLCNPHKDEDDNGTCDVCGAQIPSEDTEPNPDGEMCDHTYDDGEVLVEASCEEEGEVLYTCTKCGDSYSLILIPLGHKDDNSDGLCDDCGADLENKDDNTDDVCTHNYNSVTNIEAGCESFGEVLHTCTLCGDAYTENVDPLGHVDNDTEWPDYRCDRIAENGEPCGASTCEEHIFNKYGSEHVPGTRHDGKTCLNCKELIPTSDCEIEHVEWQPTCTKYGYVGDVCNTYGEGAPLEGTLIAPLGHYDDNLDGACDSCEMSMAQVENCLHTHFHYDNSRVDEYELVNGDYGLDTTINGLEYHWKVCDDCSMIFDLSEHTFDTLTTVLPCYYYEGYNVYACVCGVHDESTKTNITFGGGQHRKDHPDVDGDYHCDNCGTFLEYNHECVDRDNDNHCDYCDRCRCNFIDDIFEMDTDLDHYCDNCYESLNTCIDKDGDGYCDNEMGCGKHLECVDTNGDFRCDGCGSPKNIAHEHIDEENDGFCDICYDHALHSDEDGDCRCDQCYDSLCVDNDNNCICDKCGEMEDIWDNRFHIDENHDHFCDKCGTRHDVWEDYDEYFHYEYCDLCSERFNGEEHIYGEPQVREVYCGYDGYVIATLARSCECGHTEYTSYVYNAQHIDEDGDYYCDVCETCVCEHEYEREVIIESHCEEEGEIKFTCIYCGYFWTDWYSEGHSYYVVENGQDPCDSTPYTIYECENCGDRYTESDGEPLGHQYVWHDNGDGTCSGECQNDTSHVIHNQPHIDDDYNYYCDNCGTSIYNPDYGV